MFRTETIFVLDAWGSEWNVASNNGDRVERLVVTSEIMAKDYVTSDKALKGKGEAEFTGCTLRFPFSQSSASWLSKRRGSTRTMQRG